MFILEEDRLDLQLILFDYRISVRKWNYSFHNGQVQKEKLKLEACLD